MSECDLNPLTRNHLASPVAVASMYISLLKVGLVLVGAALSALGGQVQSVLMLILVVYIVYWMLTLVSTHGQLHYLLCMNLSV